MLHPSKLRPAKKRAAVLLAISTVAAALATPLTAAPAATAEAPAPAAGAAAGLRWTGCATPATRRCSVPPSRSRSTTSSPPGGRSPWP